MEILIKEVFLGGGFKYIFIFTPIPGEMIQFDEHIFQMGWNHQLVVKHSTLPTTTLLSFLLGWSEFRGKLALSFREGNKTKHNMFFFSTYAPVI